MDESIQNKIDKIHLNIFLDSSQDHLQEIDESALQLEQNPDDKELIKKLFRAVHTLKGDAAIIGLDQLTNLAHELENNLDLIRNGELVVSEELISLILKAGEIIKSQLAELIDENVKSIDPSETIISLQKLRGQNSTEIIKDNVQQVKEEKKIEVESIDLEDFQFVVFDLNDLACAFHISDIQEVVDDMHITKVPHVESFIEGVINLRGYIIPVINLEKRLNLEHTKKPDQKYQILIIVKNNFKIGLRVNEVHSVTIFNKSLIKRSEKIMLGIDHEFIDAVINDNHNLTLLLKLDKIIERNKETVQ